MAAEVLTNCVLQSLDSGSESRTRCISFLLQSISRQNFLVAPLAHCTSIRIDDASLAIVTLATTIANEEMDQISQYQLEGCEQLLILLLRAQTHPHAAVAIATLETWFILQDIPTSERHPYLRHPLFLKVLLSIASKTAYSNTFTNWEDELEIDSQEFREVRMMTKDCLVGCYFLLRVQYLEELFKTILNNQSTWNVVEAALFCISSVSREVCAPTKERGSGEAVSTDREMTTRMLIQLNTYLCAGCSNSAAVKHPLLLAAIAKYLGCYTQVWNSYCSAEQLLNLLLYLKNSLAVPAAAQNTANSIKLVLVTCSSKIVPTVNNDTGLSSHPFISYLISVVGTALSTNCEKAILLIAEGCSRLCMSFHSRKIKTQSLIFIMTPPLQKAERSLEIIKSSAHEIQVMQACEDLAQTFLFIKEILRFCDADIEEKDKAHPLIDVVTLLWPILSCTASLSMCRRDAKILEQMLAIHEQLIKILPLHVAPQFSNLITFAVQAYEETRLPCTLAFVGTAVKVFVQHTDDSLKSFSQLLDYLTKSLCTYVSTDKAPHECAQLIKSFFDMAKSYLLFCPLALVNCMEFRALFSLAVACLSGCVGERDSTRSVLNFFCQLLMTKSNETSNSQPQIMYPIEKCFAEHGQSMIKLCVGGLAGSMPQMLWPSIAECMFSIVFSFRHSSPEMANLTFSWISNALADLETTNGEKLNEELQSRITTILFGLTKRGRKSKPMIKMLLIDFAKICKGDLSLDSLIGYSLSN